MSDDAGDWVLFWAGPFSQWQRSSFALDGDSFVTAEQAMMVAKARLFGDEEIARQILATEDPGRQKALGRRVRGFDQTTWDANKVGIVARINLEKYRQNKGLRRKLFQTGEAPLAEASPMDTIWGIGMDATAARQTPPRDWPGQNLLGKVLMDVRDRLRAEFPDEATAEIADAGSIR